MDFSEIQSNTWIFSIGSILLVFIGWKVVYHNAKKIATRSESKALVDHVLKLSNESVDIAIKYWSSKDDADDDFIMTSRAFTISFGSKMSQILNFIGNLERRDICIDYALAASFQDDATLSVENKKNMTMEEKHEKCQLIVDSSLKFIGNLYSEFEKTHPPYSKVKYFPYYLEYFEPYCHYCSKSYD
ncbi:hypothetical protein [Klebsiella pneumoniae]|uniref:hypothetical protein n=1 Tax=Klebsiella pneumoniae TaxID=573 RepID=UPI000E3BEAAF|nr:hypothetical protein [Klebsiella pneumoniae]RGA35298.1 hypothetical protein DPZ17_15125 [Klebsiella pneumoniae]